MVNTYSISGPVGRGVRIKEDNGNISFQNFFGLSGAKDDVSPEGSGIFFLNTDVERTEGKKWDTKVCDYTEKICRLKLVRDPFMVEISLETDLETGVLSWKSSLTNLDRCTHTIYSCLPRIGLQGGSCQYYSIYSSWCAEEQGRWNELHAGELVLTNSNGRSTEGSVPFIKIREPQTGAAVALHILPIGDWLIRLKKLSGHRKTYMVLEAGLSDEGLHMEISPGETLALPELLFVPDVHRHGCETGIQEYILRRFHPGPLPAVVYNSWFYNFDVIDTENLKNQAKAAKELGCRTFVVDAGWFGDGVDWESQVGSWEECSAGAFQGKMLSFAEYVRSIGMDFGLWMEPERASVKSKVYQEHPDWFMKSDAIIYDLTKEEVREWLLKQAANLIRTYGISWMKIDYNTNMYRDLTGSNFYRYYLAEEVFYRELKERNPKCTFEGCASGGLRTDISNIFNKCFHGHFISDSVHPLENLRMRQGSILRTLSQYIGSWLVVQGVPFPVRSYTGHDAKNRKKYLSAGDAWWEQTVDYNLDFMLKAVLMGQPGFSGDLLSVLPEEKEQIRKAVAFYEDHRDFMKDCICTSLSPVSGINDIQGWIAMEYHNLRKGSMLIFVFRLVDDMENFLLYPEGIEKEKQYCVKTYEGEETFLAGPEILEYGIDIECANRYEGVILEISGI